MTQLPQQLKDLDRMTKREMSSLEQIVAHYMRGHKLSPTLEEYRELLEEAHAQLVIGKTRQFTVTYLVRKKGISKSKAYQAINEALEVFGEVNRDNKEGLRYLQTEWYRDMAHRLEEKDPELAILCRTRIDKINGLEDRKGGTINIAKVLMPKQIIFTTDPGALAMQQQREAEEDNHDEAEVEG